MAQRQTRKKLSPEDKAIRDDKFAVKTKEFSDNVLKTLASYYKAISELNRRVGQLQRGSYLAFPNPNGPSHPDINLTRKNMRSLDAKFTAAIMELKNYHRVASKKKAKKKNKPEDFKATFSPVVVGDAMIEFFKNENFGYIVPGNASSGRLSDKLGLIKQGYGLRNSIHMLFYIAIFNGNMQKDGTNGQLITPSQAMTNAFGGKVAALYSYDDQKRKVLNQEGLNTFDVIRKKTPTFDASQFKMYSIQSIAAANVYTLDDLEKQAPDAHKTIKDNLDEKAANDKAARDAGDAAAQRAKDEGKDEKEQADAFTYAAEAASKPIPELLRTLLAEFREIDAVRKAWTEHNETVKDSRRKAKKQQKDQAAVAPVVNVPQVRR